MSLVLLTLASFATAQAADDWNPSPEQEAVYRALSVRHDPPACSALDAKSADPVATYLYLVEHATQPAWVGMRAASCLITGHAEAALPSLRTWVVSPEHRGLAILAMGELDAMPLPIATELATLALTDGPDPDGMRARILRADAPEIRALANLPIAPATQD